ncbi:hypothetical protein B0J17DRAFT_528996, partial [Rhizoctonia solani]
GTPPHRFVLVCTQDGAWHRFDRRPETDDFCEVDETAFVTIEKILQREISMIMPPNTDLLWILSICFAISRDDQARYYGLLKYNCYFFSWTILLVVTRHALPFSVPSPHNVIQNLRPDLVHLSHSLTKKLVQALLSIVLDVITSVRDETKD